jgi:hypothetical protein
VRLWKGVPMDWTALVQFPTGRFARGSVAGHGVGCAVELHDAVEG